MKNYEDVKNYDVEDVVVEDVKDTNSTRFNTYEDYEDVDVMEFNDMSKVQKLEFLEDYIMGTCSDGDLMDAMVDFIKTQKEAVAKKNEYNKNERAKNKDAMQQQLDEIVEIMKDDESTTLWSRELLIKKTGYIDDKTGEAVTGNWMTSRLTKLVKLGLVEKCKSNIKGDRKTYYKVLNKD